jgi:hypothetical protein
MEQETDLNSDAINGGRAPAKLNLIQLAEKYQTDKLSHGYIPFYKKYLPEDPIKMLEIGVDQGLSHLMWQEYYPGTEIHGIDLFHNKLLVKEDLERKGIKCYAGDQADINFLKNIKDQFDFIIDDGSHNMDDQQLSFRHLFVNNLRGKGYYIIEDLHTSNDPFWSANVEPRSRTLNALRYFQRKKEWSSKFFPKHEAEYWRNTILEIHIHMEKIVFIKKR